MQAVEMTAVSTSWDQRIGSLNAGRCNMVRSTVSFFNQWFGVFDSCIYTIFVSSDIGVL